MFSLLIVLFHAFNFLGPNGSSLVLRFTLTAFVLLFCQVFCFCVVAVVPRVLKIWENFFTLRCFVPYNPSTHLVQPPPQTAFIKVSLGAGSSSLKVGGLPTAVRNTYPTDLFVWIRQCCTNIRTRKTFIQICQNMLMESLIVNHKNIADRFNCFVLKTKQWLQNIGNLKQIGNLHQKPFWNIHLLSHFHCF